MRSVKLSAQVVVGHDAFVNFSQTVITITFALPKSNPMHHAKSLAVLMDPIARIKPAKDSTLAMLLEARRRGWSLNYMEQGDLTLRQGEPWAQLRPLEVRDDPEDWYTLGDAQWQTLTRQRLILARKDPPFDSEYLYDTQVLERAAEAGSMVVNPPQALRDCNEKLYALRFPQCCAPTLVARRREALRAFAAEHGEIVLKPLDGMGGRGIFRSGARDPNLNVILETLVGSDERFAIAQRFIPAIREGDKRILVVDGEPMPHALARIPQGDEFRGNLAAGGRGVGVPLTDRDRWIVAQVAPDLRQRGLLFVGLDVIGDWLTEINITSPTCVRELDHQYGTNIAGALFDAVERRLA